MDRQSPSPGVAAAPSWVVRAYFDAFGRSDVDAALGLLTDDVVWHVDGAVTVPTVGFLRGRDRVRLWLASFLDNFVPRVFAINRLFELNDEVIAFGYFRHTVVSTGRTVGSDLAIRFTVRDGRIARYQILEDSLGLTRAFDPNDRWAEQTARLNGTTYAYTDRGDGPVVMFAHGLFVDRTIFAAQMTALDSTHRCIALDMPGHGNSGYRPEGWRLDDIVDDLALWIEEMRLGSVAFVGQSQGGMVGIRLAARRPDLVSRLVLIGASARAELAGGVNGWRELRRVLVSGSEAERDAAFTGMQHRLNDAAWLAREPEQASLERKIMLGHDRTGVALALDAATILRDDARELLPRIAAPTLVIHGESDRAMSPELGREIASLIPGARVAVLPGVGHHPPLEAPDQVSAELTAFLS